MHEIYSSEYKYELGRRRKVCTNYSCELIEFPTKVLQIESGLRERAAGGRLCEEEAEI